MGTHNTLPAAAQSDVAKVAKPKDLVKFFKKIKIFFFRPGGVQGARMGMCVKVPGSVELTRLDGRAVQGASLRH